MSLQKDLAALMVAMSIGSSYTPEKFNQQVCELIQKHTAHMLNAVCDKNKMTLLQYAILQNKTEFVKILIDLGADPNLSHGIKIKPIFINTFRNPEITEMLVGTGQISKADAFEYCLRIEMSNSLYPIQRHNHHTQSKNYKPWIALAVFSGSICLCFYYPNKAKILFENRVIDTIKKTCHKLLGYETSIAI